jgi:hypothetical protein
MRFLLRSVETYCKAHPASYPVGTGDPSPGVRRSDRQADHLPQSPEEVKNARSYTSIPHTSSCCGAYPYKAQWLQYVPPSLTY